LVDIALAEVSAMNHRGSYRKLLANGKAALLAAIEIYNKPRIAYRDECFVILLLNAWELVTKAALAKNHQSIFYPKRRKEPYRTYSLMDALRKAERFFPAVLGVSAIHLNLELLSTYRDNAVHFYNARYFGSVIYALAQTSIVNLKDVLKEILDIELADDITWQLLPLGLGVPIDPLDFISGRETKVKQSVAVRQFLAQIAASTQSLETQGQDTGRLLTVFKVKLESTKKIGNADVVVGVEKAPDGVKGPLVVAKAMDPNITHPLRMKELIEAVGPLHGTRLTSGTFQAIAWKYGIKANSRFCWKSSVGALTKYSHDTVAFIKRLTAGDVELAKKEYRLKTQHKKSVVPATATLPSGGQQAIS
jgi:hypothetical protein